jgi:26S proteasome regulatory subunit N8
VAVGTLSTRITSQLQSLQGLHLRLRDIGTYLQKVLDGELPVNHAILGNLQDVFNLLPNLGTTPAKPGPVATGVDNNSELARAMSIKTNDQLMAIYLSSLIRAITAFHDLIDNKIQNRQQQEEKENGPVEKDKDKEKEKGEKEKVDEQTNGEKEGEKKVNGVNGDAKGSEKKGASGKNGRKPS